MQTQHDVQHARLLLSERAVGPQHRQDGLSRGLAGNETMHDHGFVVVTGALGVVRQHHDARKTGDERDGGMNLVMRRAILRVLIVRVQQQNGAREHVHDVGRRVAHNHGGSEPVGQLALGVEHRDEPVELVLRGQFAHKQQICHLFEVEAALGSIGSQQVVHIVSAIAKASLVGDLLVVRHHVAMDVRNIRESGDDPRAVSVAQAALYIVLVVVGRVDGIDRFEVLVEGDLPLFLVAHSTSFLPRRTRPLLLVPAMRISGRPRGVRPPVALVDGRYSDASLA